MPASSRELEFTRLWQMTRPSRPKPWPFVTQHRFDAERQWRFDFAWPSFMVAVEIEGGTFSQHRRSRHTTAVGHRNDCEKYNAAATAGWCVLRYTAVDLRARPITVCEEVSRAIACRDDEVQGGAA